MLSAVTKSSWLTAVICCGAAVGLYLAPRHVESLLRNGVRDAIRPAARATAWIAQQAGTAAANWSDWRTAAADRDAAKSELERWQRQVHSLEASVVHLQHELQRQAMTGAAPTAVTRTSPLLVAELIDARVLGTSSSELCQNLPVVDRGRSVGVQESAYVLGDGPQIDQGAADQVAVGAPVYAGRCVVGKIQDVGYWTSTVLPVTDAGYRGFAQLARRIPGDDVVAHAGEGTERQAFSAGEDARLVFGARGVLEGTGGAHCRLTLIARTEPVSVGDRVYTADEDGLFPFPMFYGYVVQARLEPGTPHWEVLVEPSVTLDQIQAVQVLRKKINPDRIRPRPVPTCVRGSAREAEVRKTADFHRVECSGQ